MPSSETHVVLTSYWNPGCAGLEVGEGVDGQRTGGARREQRGHAVQLDAPTRDQPEQQRTERRRHDERGEQREAHGAPSAANI